jgi:hypothetical protein
MEEQDDISSIQESDMTRGASRIGENT